MSAVSSPIHPSAVHVILQYISPPYQLTQPIPPYLISRDLHQRHHFLRISYDNPEEYLCWPSSTKQKSQAVEMLEALPPTPHDELTSYPVQYTSDEEHTYAHVGLSPVSDNGVRVIFQWDDDGWKYHDMDIMPFPPGSRTSVQPEKTSDTVKARPDTIQVTYSSGGLDELVEDISDDDDYWNAYGANDHADEGYDHRTSSKRDSLVGTEDAYWAQYSSVHGTADSTVPSPVRQQHRKPYPISSEYDTHVDTESPNPLPVRSRHPHDDSTEDVLPIPISTIHLRPDVHAKWGAVSPRTLSRLLSTASSRPSPTHTPGHNSRQLSEHGDDSPVRENGFDIGQDLDNLVAPLELSDTDLQLDSLSVQGTLYEQETPELDEIRLPSSVSPETNGSTVVRSLGADGVGSSSTEESDKGDEKALKESLQGVWRLWKAIRQRQSGDDSDDKEHFLQVVHEVIGRD